MKKTIFMLIAAMVCFQAAACSGFAQYITGSIPDDERVKSIEVVEVKRKARGAKDLIEKKGADAFGEFREDSGKWLGSEYAIFVIEATEDSEDEGRFVLHPDVETVGKGAFDMSGINGRHFSRKVMKRKKEGKKESIWIGFVAGQEEKFPHASAVALSPDGRHYVIAAASESLLQQQHFLVSLVNAACDIIKQEGRNAFKLFLDKDSVFWFQNESYIYVLNIDGDMLFDPEHPDFVGKNVKDYPRLFPGYQYPVYSSSFAGALELAESGLFPRTSDEYTRMWKDVLIKNGFAWTAYLITEPEKKGLYRKVSYDKVVSGPDGKKYVVGSGVLVYVAESAE